MSLTSGAYLGPYEIFAPIGAGARGEVYRARDTRLDRTVAVKVLPAHVAGRPELRQRFEREARAAYAAGHLLYTRGQSLFEIRLPPLIPHSRYDVTADGQRFLVNTPIEQNSTRPITVVLNWTAGLPR